MAIWRCMRTDCPEFCRLDCLPVWGPPARPVRRMALSALLQLARRTCRETCVEPASHHTSYGGALLLSTRYNDLGFLLFAPLVLFFSLLSCVRNDEVHALALLSEDLFLGRRGANICKRTVSDLIPKTGCSGSVPTTCSILGTRACLGKCDRPTCSSLPRCAFVNDSDTCYHMSAKYLNIGRCESLPCCLPC